jgi:oligoribonuclease
MSAPIVFLDLETTGLDEYSPGAAILEVGVIVTDSDLNVIVERDWLVKPASGLPKSATLPVPVNQRVDCTTLMFDDFAYRMHTESGLIEEALAMGSPLGVVVDEAVDLIVEHCGQPPEMGGNSLGFDRRWLLRLAPPLLDSFHYRNLDVSVLRSFARRWRPDLTELEPKGEPAHRALSDLRNSIRLAKFYREMLFDV